MTARLETGDCRDALRRLIAEGVKVQMCVTSPPYWGLRDYGVEGQIGLESTPDEYLSTMVEVFRLVREVLVDDGTIWVNMGDSYNSKDLCGMPWRLAFALQADGWYLRSDIIWSKANPMPESVTDRPTKAHEYIFLLSKNPRYFYDAEAVMEPATNRESGNLDRNEFAVVDPEKGRTRANLHKIPARETRNLRTVWTIPTEAYSDAHFATFPKKLVERCVMAGTSECGHCPECGARWVRVTEVERHATRPNNSSKYGGLETDIRSTGRGNVKFGLAVRTEATVTTTGWRPTCTHNLDPIPDIVLDPFLGSGTVAEVAQHLGRGWIGIDLNPAYEPMQKKRTAQQGMALHALPSYKEMRGILGEHA